MQQSLNFAAAQHRADAGIKNAAGKAVKLAPGWIDATAQEVRLFALKLPAGAVFTIEEARACCRPMPAGADARAWGQVTRTAARQGIIERTGAYAPAASSNGSPKPLYRRGPKA